MINSNLIRKVVNYVNKYYPTDNMTYSFTTNGSLFNDNNIDFFIKHKFNLLISLDGPQNIHDKYRVDINGKGTFDRVMQGLQKIIKKNNKYYNEHINFICILTPNINFSEVVSFFSKNILFENKAV